MSETVFEKVIVLGYGQIVNKCLEKMNELKNKYSYELIYIEHESTSLSTSVELCEKNNISYYKIEDKKELTDFLFKEEDETLIISAGNFYIFPENIVNKKNYTIINFHSALLPSYPGRNAQSWAIFCGEKEAGATWHFVTKELDAGKYIIQKKCPISENTKAYELTGEIMTIAFDGFVEIIEGVLTDTYDKVQNIEIDKNRKIYKGKDIPGGGIFSITDSAEYIYRLLRSMDYGKSDIFPPVCTELDGDKIRISTYKLIDKDIDDEIVINDKEILIPFDSEKVLRLKYKHIEQ